MSGKVGVGWRKNGYEEFAGKTELCYPISVFFPVSVRQITFFSDKYTSKSACYRIRCQYRMIMSSKTLGRVIGSGFSFFFFDRFNFRFGFRFGRFLTFLTREGFALFADADSSTSSFATEITRSSFRASSNASSVMTCLGFGSLGRATFGGTLRAGFPEVGGFADEFAEAVAPCQLRKPAVTAPPNTAEASKPTT